MAEINHERPSIKLADNKKREDRREKNAKEEQFVSAAKKKTKRQKRKARMLAQYRDECLHAIAVGKNLPRPPYEIENQILKDRKLSYPRILRWLKENQ